MFNYSMIKLGYNVYEDQIPLPYRSPESLRGQPQSQASDIYCAGVVLYKLIYGMLPFNGSSQSDILRQIKGRNFN